MVGDGFVQYCRWQIMETLCGICPTLCGKTLLPPLSCHHIHSHNGMIAVMIPLNDDAESGLDPKENDWSC
jgi:hypothetical protein